ncbi:SDR family NAD(P)-dependent oxidoreductase [Xenorhabdus miraniensis]|uniref:Gluconate 5-dehydrogenase n=1 Tax=Xenorhabdus miraniensis TaxID=351674 RepID=A0A2D0JJA4_9GAMM|nr:SDR family NAD(P)-dependent oxidoreductase [Xenorhabdus miraniensis]PHM45234.1 gluconate 5-dehydrogenase [Xenorhabdus miraniensis]
MRKPITLITGTRKGIGKYLAEHYVAQGHIVVGCSRSDVDWQLTDYHHFLADVIDEQAVKALFKYIRQKFGVLDNLINPNSV